MDTYFFLHSLFITIFILSIYAPIAFCNDDDQLYRSCSGTYNCGILKDIGYPFWGNSWPQFCGHKGFELLCEEEQYPIMDIGGQKFHVLNISHLTAATMTIAPIGIWGEDACPEKFVNVSLSQSLFTLAPSARNLSFFYSCPPQIDHIPVRNRFYCTINGSLEYAYFVDESLLRINFPNLTKCNVSISVPVNQMAIDELLSGNEAVGVALNEGFDVQYTSVIMDCPACQNSGGRCGSNMTSLEFLCLCPDRPHPQMCLKSDNVNWRLKVGIGVGCGVGGILIASTVFFLYQWRKKAFKYPRSHSFSQAISSPPPTDSEQGGFPGVHHFSYTELEKATHKFDSKWELGDGGFGTVYFGKLRDGRPVAVKRLYENNYKRVEQFWNEVWILAKLRHPNLVSLYGYTSRHSRELLLVYEYISNGTVADHLHGERAERGSLSWSIRLKIAIETASALTYLHASDIIHRDVKTDNILLDENFCVKVADFGLSRLFPLNATHVSTTPQGTPGYVDPEYHECYQLTDKSDVFSFGVVLIELISSMPAVDITRHRHEINLSNMAINKIQNQALHELVDPSLGFESDNEIRAMITSVAKVAFQCLQGGKDKRPTMEEVHEALKCIQGGNYNEGKVEEMEITADEVVSLKGGPLTLSPDSVAIKWISISSTSNAST